MGITCIRLYSNGIQIQIILLDNFMFIQKNGILWLEMKFLSRRISVISQCRGGIVEWTELITLMINCSKKHLEI